MGTRIQGLWLPLITPFRDGELDGPSLRRLARYYLGQPVDGMILAPCGVSGAAAVDKGGRYRGLSLA